MAVPKSLQKHFLAKIHKHAGHQGPEPTIDRLREKAYLVGKAKDLQLL